MAASPNIVSTGSPMVFTQSEATAAQATWLFYLSNAADGTPATGKTLATTDFKISKAGAAFGNATGTITEIGLGWYKMVFAAADLNTVGALACELSGEAGVDTLHVVHQVVAADTNMTVGDIADAVWDEAASGHVSAGTFGLALQIVKGLANGNVYIDGGSGDVDGPAYDASGMLTGSRLRIYDTAAHCALATEGGNEATGLLATYTIAATGSNGRLRTFRTTES